MAWTDSLIKAGAPILKTLIDGAVGGGLAATLANAAIDALANALGVPATPQDIQNKIDADPIGTAPIVQQVEQDMARITEATSAEMQSYHKVLLQDAQSEGIISRIWRPLFAMVFTVCFAMQVVTVLWLMWTRQLGTLNQLGDVTTFLSFLDVAGCAVLGVYVWQRSDEKKQGVQ